MGGAGVRNVTHGRGGGGGERQPHRGDPVSHLDSTYTDNIVEQHLEDATRVAYARKAARADGVVDRSCFETGRHNTDGRRANMSEQPPASFLRPRLPG